MSKVEVALTITLGYEILYPVGFRACLGNRLPCVTPAKNKNVV